MQDNETPQVIGNNSIVKDVDSREKNIFVKLWKQGNEILTPLFNLFKGVNEVIPSGASEENKLVTEADFKVVTDVIPEGASEENKLVTESEFSKTETGLAELAELFFLNAKNIEVPSNKAKVGDALYADSSGNKHFICAQSLDSASIPAGYEFVGPVAYRDGDKAGILYKSETSSVKWAQMWMFKVTGLKLDGTDTFVLQQGPVTGDTPVEVGTFTASEDAVDLDTLISELDTWLRANTTAEGAIADYNWHAEKHEDVDGVDSCFIVVDNTSNQCRFSPIKSSSSGASASSYMWEWYTPMQSNYSSIRRKDGVMTYSVVWNKERFKQYGVNANNPTDSLTTPGLFSEAGFNATTVVKGFYKTYDNYLDNMVPDENAVNGAYAAFKSQADALQACFSAISFKNISGTNTNVFAAEYIASTLKAHSTASVEGLNAGDFVVPTPDMMYKILSQMKVDGSDSINTTLVKAGSSAYVLNITRWSAARGADNAKNWVTYTNGYYTGSPFNSAFRVLFAAEIDL